MLQHKKFVKKTKKNKIVQVILVFLTSPRQPEYGSNVYHCVAAIGEQGALPP